MQISPHLTFRGQCEAAFKLYERVLGGKIQTMLSYGKSPAADQVSAEWSDKIIHATLVLGDQTLMGADVLSDQFERPQGFYVAISVNSSADADRIFQALATNGVVRMALQKTFWSPAFGVLIDQFGTPWEINCEQPPG